MNNKNKENNLFENIIKVANLYVIFLGVLAIFISVGILNLNIETEIAILPPDYYFNMKSIKGMKNFDKYKYILNFPDTSDCEISYGEKIEDNKQNLRYLLPFEYAQRKFVMSTIKSPETILYFTGLSDSIKYFENPNFGFNRSPLEKKHGLRNLYNYDLLDQMGKDLLKNGYEIGYNPIYLLSRIDSIKKDNFFLEFASRTLIYNYISIMNPEQYNIENISLVIGSRLDQQPMQLVGWTSESTEVKVDSSTNPINKISININRIKKGESIEFLFKGYSYLRNDDVLISTPNLSAIDKRKVMQLMVFTLILVLILFNLEHIFRKLKNIFK